MSAPAGRGINPFVLTIFVLVAAFAILVAWLQLSYEAPPPNPNSTIVAEVEAPPPEETSKVTAAPPSREAATPAQAPPPKQTATPDERETTASPASIPDPVTETVAALEKTPSMPTMVGPPPAAAVPTAPETPTVESPRPSATLAPQPTAPPEAPAPPAKVATPPPATDTTPTAAKPTAPAAAKPAPAPADTGPPAAGTPAPARGGKTYARTFTSKPGQPRIAIVLWSLGLSRAATSTAIQRLPGEVTLGMTPYGRDLQSWADQARAAGHEVLLLLPMEPHSYPDDDPGPHTLLTSLPIEDNLQRLNWLLGRFEGYVGVTNYMGSRFTSSASDMRPILETVKQKGLIYLDSRTASNSVGFRVAGEIGLDRAVNSRFLDAEASRPAIDARLAELERVARTQGAAVGIGFPYPVTLERLTQWIATLEQKGIQLAPLTAVIETGSRG